MVYSYKEGLIFFKCAFYIFERSLTAFKGREDEELSRLDVDCLGASLSVQVVDTGLSHIVADTGLSHIEADTWLSHIKATGSSFVVGAYLFG